MNFKEEIEKVGLTEEQYEKCLSDIQDKLNGIQDLEWDEIKNKYNLNISTDTLRKAAGAKVFGGGFVKEYFQNKANRQKPMDNLDLKLEQIRKEKMKLQTLNVERNRIDRAEARQELFYESIGKVCTTLPLPDFKPFYDDDNGEMSYIFELADIHYGADFISQNNIYNREVCKERLEYALGWLIDFVQIHHVNRIHFVELGDSIQNILRLSDLRLNDIDVVKCVVEISRLLATMINKLSEYVTVEYYHVPTANHGQIRYLNAKVNELPTEDYEYIISNYIKDLVRDNPRINVHLCEEGEQFIKIDLPYHDVYAMHGHQFKSINNALEHFQNWSGQNIDALLLGHFHGGQEIVAGESTTSDYDILIASSVCGSDPYADKLFKGAKAACKIYGFNDIYGYTESYKCILN